MQTWMFFLGWEAIIVIICLVWCIRWMNVKELDEDDKMLEALTQKHLRKVQQEMEEAEKKAGTQA